MSKKIDQEIKDFHILIGKNVKEAREKKGLTQLELSLQIGQRSTTVISQAELGKNKHFNIEQLFKIAKVLECNMCDFFILK